MKDIKSIILLIWSEMQKLKSENPDAPMVMFLNYNIISLMMI